MVKPIRVFLLFVSLFGILLLVAWLFPSEGLRLSESLTLRFWQPSSLLAKEEINDGKLKLLLANTTDTLGESPLPAIKKDSTPGLSTLDSLILTYRDTLHTNISFLEYPAGDSTVLYPFFQKLIPEKRTRSLHILHYGDSQIEADRISSCLRRKFQQDFGGGGIGLFSLNAVNDFSRFVVGETSVNCERYGTNGKPAGKTGILSSFARYTSLADSADSLQRQGSYLALTFTGKLNAIEQHADFLKILYGTAAKPCAISYRLDTKENLATLPAGNGLNEVILPVRLPVRKLRIDFLSPAIPDVYAMSLEDSFGLIIDNIPIRGAAMVNFRGMNPELFRQTDSLLNIGLVILEFGVNVAKNVVNNYDYYRDIITRHIFDLRKINPNISIVIMGISDVAGKNGNGIETMKNVELIRDCQKEAARLTNCAFWDTFRAMGGRNSMPAWVANTPPLAQKDFIHFTPKGADLVGEMLYNALMLEYYSYLKTTGSHE